METKEVEIENEKSKILQILDVVQNYIFILLGIIYFIFYYSDNYGTVSDYIKDNIFMGNIILEYSNGIMAFFTVLGLIGIISRILKIALVKLVSKTKNNIDDVFVDYIIRFINITKYILSIYISFKFITISEEYIKYTDKILYIIFLTFFIYYLTSFLNIFFESVLIKKANFKSLNKNLLSFIKKAIIVSIWIIGIITILGNLGYNITALVTGAGIGGLAVALAAQKTLSNVFGAITVLLTKPFKIGDFVRVDGQTGTIKEMGLSHLTMVDGDGFFVLIPNEKLISNNIENLSKRETRRTDFGIGLIYDTTLEDLKKAVKIIENILEEYVKKETIKSFRVNFDNFGDFSLNINITYFSLLNDDYLEYVKQKEEINLKIKDSFEKEKLDMAFPTQEIIIKK